MSLAGSRYAGRWTTGALAGYKVKCEDPAYAARFPTARQCPYCLDGTTPPCWEVVFSGIDISECCVSCSFAPGGYMGVGFDVVGNPNQTYILRQNLVVWPADQACFYYRDPNDPTASMGVALRRYAHTQGPGSPTPYCPPMPPPRGEPATYYLKLQMWTEFLRLSAWRRMSGGAHLFDGFVARQIGDSCDQEFVIENNQQRIECAWGEGIPFVAGDPGGGYATIRPVWW